MKNRKPLILALPLLAVLSFLFILVVSVNTTPLCHTAGGDCTIYRMLGLGILHGRLPYVDLFDNKGVYLYLINALGQWLIPGRTGLFLLQVVNLTVTLVFLFLTAQIYCSSKKAFVAVTISLFLLAGCFQGGNHVEEWMLPYLACSIYLAANLLNRSSRISSTKTLLQKAFVWGICFGIVVMLRPNDAVAFVGGLMVGITFWLLHQREYQKALLSASVFLAGGTIAVAPPIVWFAHNGALNDMWYGIYSANSQVAGGFAGQFRTLLTWGKWAILLLMLTLCIMIVCSGHRSLLWAVIPISALHLILLGEKMYAHYFIPLFPLIVLYATMLFCLRNRPVVMLAVAILCFSHRPLPRMAILNLASSIDCIRHNQQPADPCTIPIGDRNSVWNYSADPWRTGVPMSWLIDNNIVQCNRRTGSLDAYVEETDFLKASPLWVVSYNNEFEQDPTSSLYRLADSVSTTEYTLYLYQRCLR